MDCCKQAKATPFSLFREGSSPLPRGPTKYSRDSTGREGCNKHDGHHPRCRCREHLLLHYSRQARSARRGAERYRRLPFLLSLQYIHGHRMRSKTQLRDSMRNKIRESSPPKTTVDLRNSSREIPAVPQTREAESSILSARRWSLFGTWHSV